jgi:hypothetical protein
MEQRGDSSTDSAVEVPTRCDYRFHVQSTSVASVLCFSFTAFNRPFSFLLRLQNIHDTRSSPDVANMAHCKRGSTPTPQIGVFDPSDYSFTYSMPSLTDFEYSVPTWTIPSITVPSIDIPTRVPLSITVPSYSMPNWSAPSMTAPTGGGAGGDGGGGGSDNKGDKMPDLSGVGQKANTSLKKIIGTIAGSITAFLSFVGGIWTAIKRKMKKKSDSSGDIEANKFGKDEFGHTLPFLGYQLGHAQMDTSITIEYQPLLTQNVVRLLGKRVIGRYSD